MSPATISKIEKIKANTLEWLFQQGVPTVLLAVIVWYIPSALDRVEGHIDKLNSTHAIQVERIAESFDKDQERDERLIENLLRRNGFASQSDFFAEDVP